MLPTHDAPRRDRLLRVAAALLVVAWCLRDDVQPDLYFHLAAGRDIVRAGALPSSSHWLAAADGFPFVDHEWAFQLAAWPLFAAGGPPALHLLKTLLAAACLAGVLVATARHGVARWLALAPVVLALGPRLVLRPEVASFAAIGLVLGALAWTRYRPGPRVALGLGALQVAWTNTHGLALAAPLVAVAALAAALVHRVLLARPAPPGWVTRLGPPGCPRRLGGVVLALGLGQLCHAYGPAGALYVVEQAVTAFGRDPTGALPITEFIPPLDPRVRGQPLVALVIAWAALAPALALVALRAGRARLEDLAVAGALVPLAWPYVRNLPLAALGLAPLTAAALAAALAAAARRAPWVPRAAAAGGVVLLLGLTRATLADRFHDNADHDARPGVGLGDFLAYDEAAAALDARPLGPLFNTFGSGHSLLWRRDGRAPRPFICGNLDLYPRAQLDRYHALVEGRSDWRAELEALGLRALLLDHRVEVPAFLDALLHDPGWVVWHADPHALLVARVGDAPPLDRAALARDLLGRAYADERPDGFGPTRALRAVGLLPDRPARPITRMHAALLLERLGRPGDALALARRARDLAPDFAPVVLATAELERRHGEPGAARRLYALAAELAPDSAGPLVGLGHLELAAGDAGAAAAAFRRALARRAAPEAAHGLLAALEAAGDPVELRRALAHLEVRPALRRYYEGAAARQDGDLAGAAAALEAALALEPRLAPALDRLARVRLAAGQRAEGEEALARLVEVTPASASAWRDLGTARFDLGRADGALAAWRRAAEVDPREDLALVYAAQLEVGRGRPEAAGALLAEALRRNPARPEAQALRRRLAARE